VTSQTPHATHAFLDTQPDDGGVGPSDHHTEQGPDIQDHRGVVVAFPEPDAATWAVLRFLGDTHTDLETTRIAISNRAHRAVIDRDEIEVVLDAITAGEHAAQLKLIRRFRAVAPEIAAWVKDTPGLGEKSVARLLGAIGDPIWAYPMKWVDVAPDGHTCDPDRCGARHLVALQPFQRTPAQLRAYCGWGAPNKRTKGMTQEEALALGNQSAKKIVWNIATGCIKQDGASGKRRSPYRDVYDDGKARYEITHPEWTAGHRHNAAVRLVAKAFIVDLWRIAAGQTSHHPYLKDGDRT